MEETEGDSREDLRIGVHPDVAMLFGKLPREYCVAIADAEREGRQIVDIVVQVRQVPRLRFADGSEAEIGSQPVDREEFDQIARKLYGGRVNARHRAAIEESLHRISVMPTKDNLGATGFTLRIGRDFPKSADIIEDILVQRVVAAHDPQTGVGRESVAIVGAPKNGKTTMLRAAARKLAKAGLVVVVVDKSNEIGGDGDVPHSALGRVIRLQVPEGVPYAQMLLEAVENHSADVVVADEISDWKEAQAALTISKRGVSLVATLHGRTLADVVDNRELQPLIGDINDKVILGDKTAKARPGSNAQQGVLNKNQRERKSPPVPSILIEKDSLTTVTIVSNVAGAVDAHLHGLSYRVEKREAQESGPPVIRTFTRSAVPVKASYPATAEVSAQTGKMLTISQDGPIRVWADPLISEAEFKRAVAQAALRLGVVAVDSIADADLLIVRDERKLDLSQKRPDAEVIQKGNQKLRQQQLFSLLNNCIAPKTNPERQPTAEPLEGAA